MEGRQQTCKKALARSSLLGERKSAAFPVMYSGDPNSEANWADAEARKDAAHRARGKSVSPETNMSEAARKRDKRMSRHKISGEAKSCGDAFLAKE